MRRALLIMSMFLVALTSIGWQVVHGPYADKEGWVCYYGPTREDAKRVHCECKSKCDNDGMEDKTCMTYCTSPKCQCHLDSNCEHHAH